MLSFLFLYLAPQEQDEFISEITKKFQRFNQVFPREKVYVQLNKIIFKPKELLWFKAYIVESLQHKPSDRSKDFTIKLIDETGQVVFKDRYSIKNGLAQGTVKLSKSLKEGIYTLVGYSNWMQNGSEHDVFHQQITIVNSILPKFFMNVDLNDSLYHSNDSVRAKISVWTRKKQPIKNLKINYEIRMTDEIVKKGNQKTNKNGLTQIQFTIPQHIEHQLIVLKLESKFKNNVETRAILIPTQKDNIEIIFFPEGGSLVDGIHSRIAFQAVDDVMNPIHISGVVVNQKGDVITNLETSNNGIGIFSITPSIKDTYEVRLINPKKQEKKCILPEVSKNGIAVSIDSVNREFIFVKAASNSPHPQRTFWITRIGGYLHWISNALLKDSLLLRIPVKEYPMGIAQITVFDSIGAHQAERLVFVNKHKQANIKIYPDKNEYLPREETNISIQVTDEADMPLPIELCLSVLPEHRLFAETTPHLLATFLLSSELKHKIFNPNFYVAETFLSDGAIDCLLMTQSARCFSWDKVLSFDESKGLNSISDGAVSGFVYDKNEMPVVNTRVWLINSDGQLFDTISDDKGEFRFFSDGASVLDVQLIKADNVKKQENFQVMIERNFDEQLNHYFTANMRERILNEIELDRYKYSPDWTDEKLLTQAIYIDEHFSNTEKADYKDKKIPPWKRHIIDVGILEAIKMIKPYQIIGGVIVFHGVSSMQAPAGALIVIDGLKLGHDPGLLSGINPYDVENIQVYTSPSDILRFASFAAEGVIEIKTKGSGREQKKSEIEIHQQTMKNPFWMSRLKLDECVEIDFSYYNPNQPLSIIGIIEGISEKGKMVRGTFHYCIR